MSNWTKSGADYEDRTLIRFSNPAEISGTGFLTHQHGKGEDDMWMYIPSLKKVKRLAATERKDPFVGSDFAYEDLRTENLLAFDYKLLEKKHVKALETDCYVVEALPATEGEKRGSGYVARHLWISTDWLLRRVDYFVDEGGKQALLKTLFYHDYQTQEAWKGFRRADRMAMHHKKKSSRTEFVFDQSKRKIDTGLDDDSFSQRTLSTP